MTVYLIRHADALSRQEWAHDDHERPLTPKGFDQARGLVDLLGDAAVTRMLTSPTVRCRQTLEPLAAHLGLVVDDAPALLEGVALGDARALLDEAAGHDGDVALCSHGDLIPDLVRHLVAEGMEAHGRDAKKGSTWVLEHDGRRFVRGRYLPAP
ncbi:MAG: histidine phosphatase family protein [Acidimicrobiales bacterium]|nr:histidine phosphatase family protein [Acidimicrobiales bacterium]MCB1017618.1 histidine phosphatase family protein [Acidimicrobiales bacterium]MCB9373070.1 histidine phosphatase family protein [Microthrixaceae bacterium]